MNHLKYLMIQYAHGGRGWEQGDCFNLLLRYYEEEFGIQLKDYTGYDEKWYVEKNYFVELAGRWGFTKVETPASGDVVLLSKRGRVQHCGIFISTEYVLHTNHRGTALHSWLSLPDGLKVFGYYRHKDVTHADKVS